MSLLLRRGMVLAAGLGLRMRPLTERCPKPLLRLRGRTLVDHALDRFVVAGITDAVVNCHYLSEQIVAHLTPRMVPRLQFSAEPRLLETGGGVTQALPMLGPDPFAVANGDIVWLDAARPALGRLADAWDDGLDALLLLARTVTAHGYDGAGDFFLDPNGGVRRRKRGEVAPFVFAGVQILHPRLFERCLPEPFSLNRLYDRAIAAGRLRGLVHDGLWFHLGTPRDLIEAEGWLADRHYLEQEG